MLFFEASQHIGEHAVCDQERADAPLVEVFYELREVWVCSRLASERYSEMERLLHRADLELVRGRAALESLELMDVGLNAGINDTLWIIDLVLVRHFISVTPAIHAIHHAQVGSWGHLHATMAVYPIELLLVADAISLERLLCPLADLDSSVIACELIALLSEKVFVDWVHSRTQDGAG